MNLFRYRDFLLWSLGVCAVILNAILAINNINNMVLTERMIQQTRNIQNRFETLLSTLIDAETGHRGYILTSQQAYLEPFRKGQIESKKQIEELQVLLEENKSQQERFDEITDLIKIKYAEMSRTILIHDQNSRETAILEIKKDRGKIVMDTIRLRIRNAVDEEGTRVQVREFEYQRQIQWARVTTFIAAFITVLVILLGGVLVRSELRRRLRANRNLQKANEQLESLFVTVKESENRFRQLTDAMPQIVWMARYDGFHEYFNARWYEYTGVTPEQIIGFHWIDYLHRDDRDRTLARWDYSLKSGNSFELEYRLCGSNGNYRWFLSRANSVRDSKGTIIHWLGTCTDIDDNKRLTDNLDRTIQERTAALSEQRAFLDVILNNIREGIVACNEDGQLLFNKATKEMHGIEAENIPQADWAQHYDLFETDGITQLAPADIPLTRAWRGEVVDNIEMIIQPKLQPQRYVQCSGQQLLNSQQQVIGAVVSMRDITERRQYEQDLLNSARLLKASNEELEKFAYIASHDLQEPLRKIQSFGDRILKKQKDRLDSEGQDAMDRMLESAGRMRQLIEDLLAFSRVSTTIKPFECVDLNVVLKDVLSTFDARLDTIGGKFTSTRLPTVDGDASQLRQLFQNLIGNAIKFSKPEQPPIIQIEAVEFNSLSEEEDPPKPEGDGWRIYFRDYGIGFEQQYADRIFELFQRLHGRSQYEGTGLGLAICKKIAQRHGVNIQVRSQPGVGTTFILDWQVKS